MKFSFLPDVCIERRHTAKALAETLSVPLQGEFVNTALVEHLFFSVFKFVCHSWTNFFPLVWSLSASHSRVIFTMPLLTKGVRDRRQMWQGESRRNTQFGTNCGRLPAAFLAAKRSAIWRRTDPSYLCIGNFIGSADELPRNKKSPDAHAPGPSVKYEFELKTIIFSKPPTTISWTASAAVPFQMRHSGHVGRLPCFLFLLEGLHPFGMPPSSSGVVRVIHS